MLRRILENHILTTLVMLLALALGIVAYLALPREQDPTVNFNYIDISTMLPGASAEDVEERVTEIIEEAVSRVENVRAVNSFSRLGYSAVGVRFENLSDRLFDERLTDLRREVQASQGLLPAEATQPIVTKVTSANNMPTVMLALVADRIDEGVIRTSRRIENELEKMRGIERVDAEGDREIQLQVLFDPAAMANASLEPVALADTVATYFRNVAAGTIEIGDSEWLVRLVGTSADPGYLAELPILTARGEIPLRS
ncbi:MAG: efflux RND transporter permease subunit, partial [Spongiibacteraceae bacterium]|nr:efflux RND transporter permease subunit [Spongiibacteraceae bacterium]